MQKREGPSAQIKLLLPQNNSSSQLPVELATGAGLLTSQ